MEHAAFIVGEASSMDMMLKAILRSKALTQAREILDDNSALIAIGDALSHDSVGQFCTEATKINDELAALQWDSESLNRFNPMDIVKHRRCLNHAIEFRVRVRKELLRLRMTHLISHQRFISDKETPAGRTQYHQIRLSAPFPDPVIERSEIFAVGVESEAELYSELPLYEESATVGLILGPTEWGDDGPSLVRAIDSMPGAADGKQITVDRMDESGMLVVQTSLERAAAAGVRERACAASGRTIS
ncbi:hypothetical protein DFH09DRAFT_499799 [Mycena vulgaris]|nr:hypothetical protein DFH09DRAFT_1285247 [Mycena vulgaris]KAJ6601734.1 hypothetical protein DFH09DRAFT_499799 [Mycena vulgaris]